MSRSRSGSSTATCSCTETGIATRRLLRLAAGGDWHCDPDAPRFAGFARAFTRAAGGAGLALLAGDLTAHGEPEQAAVVAAACREAGVPALAVLGNHDHDAARRDELVAVLENGGVTVLDGTARVLVVEGIRVGVAGTTGYFGGFPDAPASGLGDEAAGRATDRARRHADALREGLQTVAGCDVRIVLLHYAPTTSTLAGEPERLWGRLGAAALGEAILEHAPDLVVHAHAHAGTFRGAVGSVPTFNVSSAVLRRELCRLDVPVAERSEPTHRGS
jgi:uncharacterized protein